jgi:hypothetical protein
MVPGQAMRTTSAQSQLRLHKKQDRTSRFLQIPKKFEPENSNYFTKHGLGLRSAVHIDARPAELKAMSLQSL